MGVTYQCDRCRSRQPVFDEPVAYYTLPDGRGFFGSHATGWCPGCRLLAEVEAVPTSEVVGALVAGLTRPGLQHSEGLADHLAAVRDWSRARREPPRCLRCGCRDFTPLRADGDGLTESGPGAGRPFRHPACGGAFRVREVTHDQPAAKCLAADGTPTGHRWDAALVRSLRRLLCWASGRRYG